MALEKTIETAEVKVPGKGQVQYSYEVLKGTFEDALQHANGNNALLGEAYFDSLNASEKANKRQKAYNDNISPELKAKANGIAAIKVAFKVSQAEAEAMWAKLNGEDATTADPDNE